MSSRSFRVRVVCAVAGVAALLTACAGPVATTEPAPAPTDQVASIGAVASEALQHILDAQHPQAEPDQATIDLLERMTTMMVDSMQQVLDAARQPH